MNSHQDWNRSQLEGELQQVTTTVWDLARQQQGNSEGLLLLLRTLEHLHRQIREQMFEPSLPDTRQDLYHLLREIEETGGWPYIERMKIQSLLLKLLSQDAPTTEKMENS